jgi:hypothetical protein
MTKDNRGKTGLYLRHIVNNLNEAAHFAEHLIENGINQNDLPYVIDCLSNSRQIVDQIKQLVLSAATKKDA